MDHSVFIFDLHNTLYDEVMEYGLAMRDAMDFILETAQKQGTNLSHETLAKDIENAHRASMSDWDNRIWASLPCLQDIKAASGDIDDFTNAIITRRKKRSKDETRKTQYKQTIAAIRTLKDDGHSVYLATEGTENAVSEALIWLDIDALFDGIYCRPFEHDRAAIKTRAFYPDPVLPDIALEKPNALIIGQIILDHAKQHHAIAPHTTWQDVFSLQQNNATDDLAITIPDAQSQAHLASMQRAITSHLTLNKSDAAPILKTLLSKSWFIGDSFFKDGLMAANANVNFIHAAYGKKCQSDREGDFKVAKKTLMDVTGWDKSVMQMTQEAEKIPALESRINTAYVCENSLQDFIDSPLYQKESTAS